MPTWYLIASAVFSIAVLVAVGFAELRARRSHAEREAFAGDFDPALADAPIQREAAHGFERPRPKADRGVATGSSAPGSRAADQYERVRD